MKTVLEEAQVRAALASIAGTEPGGIAIIATEMKTSDVAVGAAFGALGATIAQSGRPNYHIIHRTAMGFYFVPVYVQKSKFYIAPAENFFIPHTEIKSFNIVLGMVGGGMRIDVKLQNGKKLQFNGNRHVKNVPFQTANVERLYEIYKESSRGAQRKNKITFITCIVLFIAMIGVLVGLSLSEDSGSPSAEDGSLRMQTQTIAGTFSMQVPESFLALSEAELAEQDNPEREILAAFYHPQREVDLCVYRVPAEVTHKELLANNADGSISGNVKFRHKEINGKTLLCSEDISDTYFATVQFVEDDYLYTVLYSCDDSVYKTWGGVADDILLSVTLLSPNETAQPAA